MPTYDWLLLDADGTLFDYDAAESTALRQTLEAAGHAFQPSYLPAYAAINGEMWLALEQGNITPERLRTRRFELWSEAIGVPIDAAWFSDVYLRHLSLCTDLLAGAEETVRALAGRVRMLVITNGLRDVQTPRLARSAIAGYMAGMIISEEVGAAKPAGEIFDAAFARMGQPDRARVLMVGDSLTSDMQGGYDYGIDTCWFNPAGAPGCPSLPVTYQITRLSELLQIVE
jgi:2-haloacid dehalogenase